MKIKKFTFNPFSENTYVISDHNTAAIIDPGMSNSIEQNAVIDYLNAENLELKHLINTHCHIDHILGNRFIADKFGLTLQSSKEESLTLSFAAQSAQLWSIAYVESPEIELYLSEGDVIEIGDSKWEVLSVPGHSVGHLVFVNHREKVIIGGDTLFYESIGRTDLPGGDHELLLSSIQNKLFVLDSDFVVYSGHGPETTIGYEKANNPWFN